MSFGELQNLVLSQLKRDFANFKKTGESRRTTNYLSTRLALLEDSLVTSRRYHEEIMIAGKLEKEFKKEDVVELYQQIQETYLEYKCELLDAMDKCAPTSKAQAVATTAPSAPLASAVSSSRELRLPKINIPEFSGSYTKWRAFHDIFVSLIHNNESLGEIQKFHYLKSSLTGDAARLLQHLSLDAGNYKKAWELLKARFDHKRVLVNAQFKVFFNQPSLGKESAEGLRTILDVSSESLHALENLGLPVDQWDAIVVYILFQKLPSLTQQLWEEKWGNNKELPKRSQFNEFLETRFRTLEAVAQQGAARSIAKPWSKSESNPKVFHASAQSKQFSCKVCNQGQHSLRKCKRFLGMDVTHRQQSVRQAKVCENCLAYSHPTRECPSSKDCYFCHQRHHSLLHPTTHAHTSSPYTYTTTPRIQHHHGSTQTEQVAVNPNAPTFHPMSDNQPSSSRRNAFHASQQVNTNVLLATAVVQVRSSDGRYVYLRALIDPGSEATFISEAAAQLLKLPKHRTHVQVSGLGKVSNGTSQHYVDVTFTSRDSTFESSARALVFKSLTGLLPAKSMIPDKWNHINGLQLADPSFNTPAKIDLLFGMDVYSEVILPDIIRIDDVNSPVAQKTKLGWVVIGKVPEDIPRSIKAFVQLTTLDTQLRKFWEVEEAPFRVQDSEEDIVCEKHFTATTKRLADGRYEVTLPFKGGKRPALGASREVALRRFASLERRFQSNERLRTGYSQCIMEYLSLQHMEEVDMDNDAVIKSPYHTFLPHHAVLKEASTTTKLRVVFDAAAKTTHGTSLNDNLMVGPKLQSNIVDIILRWRRHRYTFTADVEKMYRQIWVSPPDSYYQLILWRESESQPVKAFRLKTVTFGTACAPYLAIRILHQVANDEAHRYPIGAQSVKEDMYVDDLISGADNIQEARQKRDEVRKLLASAGLNLRKWTSNQKELIEDIPDQDREIEFDVPLGSPVHVKTLGIRWFPKTDSFSFKNCHSEAQEPTKRAILSAIAKLFDPLGWISPCIIKAKILMQQLWQRGSDWDQPIPAELNHEWENFQRELPMIEGIAIPRWVGTHKNCKAIELHGFSDASTKAYGAAVYIRVLDYTNKTHMHLLMAKTKVAPLNTVSLPRLELCGAVMVSTLLHHIKNVLEMQHVNSYAWSDSTITLAWIRAPPTKWTTFVSNRVAEIQRLTKHDEWRHIPTHDNPADLASRGISPSLLGAQDLWWKGPPFLRKQWEFQEPDQPLSTETVEEIRRVRTHHVTTQDTNDSVITLIHKFSRLSKVVRVLAFCLRFIQNCRTEATARKMSALEPTELQLAALVAIRTTQKEMCSSELHQGKNNNAIPKSLKALNPFFDGQGIIRVGGRLQFALLPYEQKHPIILHPNHHFTELVISDAHHRTLHGGLQQMVAYIRTKYWILHIKRAVKKHIHKCLVCFRHKAQHMQQLMGSLPAPRVRMARPFANAGVDYAGPIEIKTWKGRNAKSLKGYFAIFVCLATKAIHIEVVSDLTTQAFLAAFRRFTARRGICSQLYSDCGTNFVGASTELDRMMKDAKHDWAEVAEILSDQGTKWRFIPPASPHFGGLWEAGVKSIKHHLKRATGDAKLTFEELYTLLTQIEACLNSRPLCPLSDNPEDLDVITPEHFLIGEALHTVPQGDTSHANVSTIDRWKRIQCFTDGFWRKWYSEYLSRLQQRPKWLKTEDQPRIGDLVIVKDERLPPSQWMLARIEKVHPGADGLIRVVTIKTKTGKFKRPLSKICYLPSNKTNENDTII